jgi:hypothetical protein
MSNILYASFSDALSAERAVGALLDHGVRKEDVSVVSSHNAKTIEHPRSDVEGVAYEPIFGYNAALGAVAVPPIYTDIPARSAPAGEAEGVPRSEVSASSELPDAQRNLNDNTNQAAASGARGAGDYVDTSKDTEDVAKSGITTTTAKDAEEGALKGTAWGAGLGILAGLAALIVPGVGLVYGGGALALAIAGAAGTTAAGAAAGAVTGLLVDQGVDVKSAEDYQDTIDKGGALFAVTVPSGAVSEENAQHLLLKYGSFTISTSRKGGYIL